MFLAAKKCLCYPATDWCERVVIGRLDVITIGFLAARLLVVYPPEVHGLPFPRLNLSCLLINSIAEFRLTVLARDLFTTPPLQKQLALGGSHCFVEVLVQPRQVCADAVQLVDKDQKWLMQLHRIALDLFDVLANLSLLNRHRQSLGWLAS